MEFRVFKNNVEGWAEARGIYRRSTPLAQILKAVSEMGELADACIKGEADQLHDGIGDVTVCLVNYTRMIGIELYEPAIMQRLDLGGAGTVEERQELTALVAGQVGMLAMLTLDIAEHFSAIKESIAETAVILSALASAADTTLNACCQLAWNEIKDRKGSMSASGAWVKEAV